jgi:DNA-binding NtrC family response regulator
MGFKVALVEDNEMYASMLEHALKEEGYHVEIFSTGKAFLERMNEDFSILVLDQGLPDISGMEVLNFVDKSVKKLPVVLISGQEDVNVVVEAYDSGASNYIIKNDQAVLKLKQALKNITKFIELEDEVVLLREEVHDRSRYGEIIGESSALFKVLKLIQRVEKTDTLVMITGASGTGKEVVARAIHRNSKRRRKPFVAVNVAAIPDELLEDELFGHDRGAFTGASGKRKGRFEEAHGGTIFLDEIGEMDLKLQTKLLRVLQEKKVSRLGSNKEINLDVRIIAATNKNLGQLVKQGLFREDLYYRIQGFLIHLPMLKDRGDDVVVLARHFMKMFSEKYNAGEVTLDGSAERKLMDHIWSGNVRELMSVIDRCILMRDGNVITGNDLIFSDSI